MTFLNKIRSLQNNQIVKYRVGKAGESDVIWGEWEVGPLYMQKRVTGEVITIVPRNTISAEFDEKDFDEQYNCFNCEEYYLEIDWNSLK